jgi:hypothetical protein
VNPFRSPLAPPYVVHKWMLALSFVLWLIGCIAGSLAFITAGAVASMVSGSSAILAGRSVVTGIGIGGHEQEWSERELAEMGPGQRAGHALLTGAVLILLGLAALGIVGLSVRQRWLAERRAALEEARGAAVWHPDLKAGPPTLGTHGWYDALAIADGRICYGASGGSFGAEIRCTPRDRSYSLDGRVLRRLQFSGDRLLWASDESAGIVTPANGLRAAVGRWKIQGQPRALAATRRWVAWEERGAIVAGQLNATQTQRFEVNLAAQGRVVLAGLGERLLFGPAPGCALKSLVLDSGETQCVMPAARRPVAAFVTADQVALAFEDGELFTISDTESKRWGKVSAPLALSLAGTRLFVVARDGVYRLSAAGAVAEALFAHALEQCEAVGPFGELLACYLELELRVGSSVQRHGWAVECSPRLMQLGSLQTS